MVVVRQSLPLVLPRASPKPVASPLKKVNQAIKSLISGQSVDSDQLPEFSEVQLRAYFENRDQQLWLGQGDSWRDGEWQTLLSFLGDYSCGGRWVEPQIPTDSVLHELHRCPNCRSRSFKYWYPDIVFD